MIINNCDSNKQIISKVKIYNSYDNIIYLSCGRYYFFKLCLKVLMQLGFF